MTELPSYALVLTAQPGSGNLTPKVEALAVAALPIGSHVGSEWLSPGEAWEAHLILPSPETARTVRSAIGRALGDHPIDVNVVAGTSAARRKRLLISDMDSTIIEQECIDEMADVVGLKPRIAAITERAMRGELDFEAALQERLGLLAGLTEVDLARVLAERITLMPGARTLTGTMRAHGAFTALVSGGFTYFTSRIAARAGFEVDHANRLDMRSGRLTGHALPPILGREAKRETLSRLTVERGLAAEATLAVGDGANDLAMIKLAGLGVAYRAKPAVAAEAAAAIVHGDLTALLYLQGYRRYQFIEV